MARLFDLFFIRLLHGRVCCRDFFTKCFSDCPQRLSGNPFLPSHGHRHRSLELYRALHDESPVSLFLIPLPLRFRVHPPYSLPVLAPFFFPFYPTSSVLFYFTYALSLFDPPSLSFLLCSVPFLILSLRVFHKTVNSDPPPPSLLYFALLPPLSPVSLFCITLQPVIHILFCVLPPPIITPSDSSHFPPPPPSTLLCPFR